MRNSTTMISTIAIIPWDKYMWEAIRYSTTKGCVVSADAVVVGRSSLFCAETPRWTEST